MNWWQTADINLFRFINHDLANPVLDRIMPFVSSNTFFHPALVLLGIVLIWKGRLRGLICLLMLLAVVAIGDGFICRTLKHAIDRPRPFLTLEDVRCLIGKGGSGSMPSSHAANWFSAAMVAFIYYRRSLWFMLPAALVISFSRVYNGVHYPSDVLAGAVLGAGYAVAIVLLLDWTWRTVGGKWFPIWWSKFPALLNPPQRTTSDEPEEPNYAPRGARSFGPMPQVSIDQHWTSLGYIVIAILLLARLFYIGSGEIQLSEDEAYQWVWSKHLALSYYSKPPLIAYTQFLGTSLWGDNEFGVRFFSPVISAVLGLIALRFFARHVNARAGFFLVLILNAAPLLATGSVLMTIDPLSVLFWSAAMFAGWSAVQPNSTLREWFWVGLWMGLGFLSKYTELFQILCWAVFFILRKPARVHLRRPGPYFALLINAVCALPVLIWNYQHEWITVAHVADNAGAGSDWKPTLRYLIDFIGVELGLLNPVFFGATAWAAVSFWKRNRQNPLLIYLFSMGAPVFAAYILQSFRTRILPNWIAPSVLPLFALMVIYWDLRYRLGMVRLKPWLVAGFVIGFATVVVGHDTDLVPKLFKYRLPVALDPLHRVREWDTTAQTVNKVRQELMAEGKPVFIITDHYGMAGQITFYLPQARQAVTETPLVYYRSSPVPENQFYFLSGYTNRTGENAIFVRELNRKEPQPSPPPKSLVHQFESVTDLGVRNVMYHGMLLRPLQMFACRNLK